MRHRRRNGARWFLNVREESDKCFLSAGRPACGGLHGLFTGTEVPRFRVFLRLNVRCRGLISINRYALIGGGRDLREAACSSLFASRKQAVYWSEIALDFAWLFILME